MKEHLAHYVDLHKEHVYKVVRQPDREQVLWRFPNDYGASVSSNAITHHVAELAVVKFRGENEYDLVYDTGITSDVIPYIGVSETNMTLERIKNL